MEALGLHQLEEQALALAAEAARASVGGDALKKLPALEPSQSKVCSVRSARALLDRAHVLDPSRRGRGRPDCAQNPRATALPLIASRRTIRASLKARFIGVRQCSHLSFTQRTHPHTHARVRARGSCAAYMCCLEGLALRDRRVREREPPQLCELRVRRAESARQPRIGPGDVAP